MRKFLVLTAAALVLSAPALAQETAQPSVQAGQPPAVQAPQPSEKQAADAAPAKGAQEKDEAGAKKEKPAPKADPLVLAQDELRAKDKAFWEDLRKQDIETRAKVRALGKTDVEKSRVMYEDYMLARAKKIETHRQEVDAAYNKLKEGLKKRLLEQQKKREDDQAAAEQKQAEAMKAQARQTAQQKQGEQGGRKVRDARSLNSSSAPAASPPKRAPSEHLGGRPHGQPH